jgi:hypothetical protein
MNIVSKLKEIIHLKDEIERHLKTLIEIENVVRYLYEKYFCEDVEDNCKLLTKKLEKWVRLYKYIEEEKDLNDLIQRLEHYGFKLYVDWHKPELIEICDDCYHCIQVHEKIPLEETARQKYLH